MPTEEEVIAANGVIEFLVANGTKGSGSILKDGEKYYLCIALPKGMPTVDVGSLRTGASEAGKLLYNFNMKTGLKRQLKSDDKCVFTMFMHNSVWADEKVGVGELSLQDLFNGNKISQDVKITGTKGEDVAAISVRFGWENDSVPNMGGPKGGGLPQGNASAQMVAKNAQNQQVQLAPLPNCEGNDYVIRIRCHKAKNLQSQKEDTLFDPLVTVRIKDEVQQTEYADETNNPIWDEELVFQFDKVSKEFWNNPVLVTVMDHHIAIPNSKIGSTQLDLGTVYREKNHFMEYKWFVLHRSAVDGNVMGFVKLSICVLDLRKDPVPEPTEEVNADDEDTLIANLVSGPGARFEEIQMICEVYRGMDFPQMDISLNPWGKGTADPYVRFTFGTCQVNTLVIKDTLDPVWNVRVKLPMLLPSLTSTLAISVWDSDDLSCDDLIGTQRVEFQKLMNMGKAGLPKFPCRWVNLYGGPRGFDADFNSHFKAMMKGEAEGLDYRGRILLKMTGKRPDGTAAVPGTVTSGRPPQIAAPEEVVVEVIGVVQILQLCMVPKGKYQFVASQGLFTAKSNVREAVKMKQGDLAAVYFGEELKVEGKFPVIAPKEEGDIPVADQIPDIVLHLVPEGKELPFAAMRFAANKMIETGQGQYQCSVMTVFTDPAKISEGEQPTHPMVQATFGNYIVATKPPAPAIRLREAIRMPAIPSLEAEEHRLECCVYMARQLPAGDDNGLSDPFLRISWGNSSAQTGQKIETLNPLYMEMLPIYAECKQPFPDIIVEVWDYDFWGSNTYLCKTIIPFADAQGEGAGKPKWYTNLTNSQAKKVPGTDLLLSFEVMKVTAKNKANFEKAPRQKFLKQVGETDTYEGYSIPESKALPMSFYKINSQIFSLRHMRSFRLMNIKCPSIEVEVAGHVQQIEKIYGSNPDFNKEFDMYVELPSNGQFLPRLNFRVFDNRWGPKSLVGTASVAIDSQKYAPQWKKMALIEADNAVAARLIKINEVKGIMGSGAPPPAAVESHVQAVRAVGRMTMIQTKQKKRKALDGQPGSEANGELYEQLLSEAEKEHSSDPSSAVATTTTTTTTSPKGEKTVSVKVEEPPKSVSRGAVTTTSPQGTKVKTVKCMEDDCKGMASCDDALSQLFVAHEELEKAEGMMKANKEEAEVETLWFDKFDPEGRNINPEDQVTRLGKITGVLPPNKTRMDDYYGPFDDEIQTVVLKRGWGSDCGKAGSLLYDLTVVKIAPKDVSPTLVNETPETREQSLKKIESRQPVKFIVHIYCIGCSNLAPKDDSFLGKASDPFLVFSLTGNSKKEDCINLSCEEEKKFQTLNPEFFITRQMQGILPKQNTLRVTVYDYDKIGSNELIGYTDINLEDRWHSRRGYKTRNMTTLRQGTYTEKRYLRNDAGQLQGTIEMWVDMYDIEYQKVPRPLEISPPPPIPLELRVTIWNTRDVILQETSINGEEMTDIYVRCWLDGMSHNMQATDVHYRSLDGTGNFNWRMIFPLVFEPRSKKIMPQNDKSTLASFFHIRKETKKFEPVLHCQIFDNDLLPGTDDYIGETNLRLLELKPTNTRRNLETLVGMMTKDLSRCCDCWPFNTCCMKKVEPPEPTLKEKQKIAAEEAMADRREQEKKWRSQAKKKVQAMREAGKYSEIQLERLEKNIFEDLRRSSRINIFKDYFPKPRSVKKDGDKGNKDAGKEDANDDSSAEGTGDEAEQKNNSGKPNKSKSGSGLSMDKIPKVSETGKFWFPARGPNGGGRCGDIQISFQLVRSDLIETDKALQAGKGRSDPNKLPEPKRPDSSFFWLDSPFKSAIHILWKNYKWYIITLVCLALSAILIYVFVSQGVSTKSNNIFGGNPKPQNNVYIDLTTPKPT